MSGTGGVISGVIGNHPRLNDLLGGKLSVLHGPGAVTGAIIQHGHFTGQNAGWYTVTFASAFSSLPDVVAVQGPRGQSLTTLKIPAPTIPVRTIATPTLPTLALKKPSTTPWGDTWAAAWNASCSKYMSFLSGFCSPMATMLKLVGNAFWAFWYGANGDWSAIASGIETAVENKAITDINDVIGVVQGVINGMVGDINDMIARFTGDAQAAVNDIFTAMNTVIGLAPGLAIPATLVRNVTTTGCEIYSPGSGVQIFWIATSSSG